MASLIDKVRQHVAGEAPLGVHVLALGDKINLLSWQRGWWVEIKPTQPELRLAYGPRWTMTEYRAEGIASQAMACGDWEVLTWLGSLWRDRRFLQHHLAPIQARVQAIRNPARRHI
jgi:hypothetical protein